MRRFAKFLSEMFATMDSSRLPAAATDMTLHDAIRICATGRRTHHVPVATTRLDLRQIDIVRYRSEAELHDQWHCFNKRHRTTAGLTVILALDDFLRGNLRDLVRQRQSAHRLVIVPRGGHWPGSDSFGDLALSPTTLGWRFIDLHRDLGEALKLVLTNVGHDDRLLMLLPA